MAGNDVFLYSVPSDANKNDVRLNDPTQVAGKSQVLAITLDDVVVAISQSKATSNSQALAATLDGVTVAVAQTYNHSQALAITLDTVTASATQNLSHSQAMAITLDGVTVAVSQVANHPQSLAITLDDVVVAISQSNAGASNSQALNITLDSVTSSITQALSHAQSLAVTLDDVVVSITQQSSLSESKGAGSYGKTKKNYIIHKDNQILVFKNKQEAVDHLNNDENISATSELNALIDIDISETIENEPQVAKQALQPVYNVNAMLSALKANAQAEQLLNERKYQALLAMYEQYLDEEDIEILLLAA